MPKTYKGRKSNPRKNNSRKSYRKNTNKTYKIKYSNFTKEAIVLHAYNSPDDFKQKIEEYKQYLSDMNASGTLNLTTNSDLFSIRDEILANLNQFTYLWSFTK